MPVRGTALTQLGTSAWDLLVVGGGIVGAGIVRDAALRGLRAALVDRHDFAFGTSSRSSRLLHGGMRYLAQGRLGLVRESSVEKRVVHRIAPHLAAPLAFVFPAYRGRGWPLWQLRIGVRLYDMLCGGRNFGRSGGHDAAETLRLAPGLQPAGLAGSVRYFDGLTNDARLVVDTLRSAARAGATLANYTSLRAAEGDRTGWTAQLRDEETGREFSARCRTLVNATGPWAAGLPHSGVRLRCTKGVHLVFDRARLPVGDALAITEGGRILFLLPWGERTIMGTTDTDYRGRPEDVRVDPADITYLLGVADDYFPGLKLTETDILSRWAGIRPLLEDPNGHPSDISRSHQITRPKPGWWDVAGGKLTTYRLMAEQTVDQVAKFLGGAGARCRTALEPLLSPGETQWSGLVPPGVTRECVEHFCRREWARNLADVMERRTGWSFYEREPREVARLVHDWMAEIHGWSSDQARAEWEKFATASLQSSCLPPPHPVSRS